MPKVVICPRQICYEESLSYGHTKILIHVSGLEGVAGIHEHTRKVMDTGLSLFLFIKASHFYHVQLDAFSFGEKGGGN